MVKRHWKLIVLALLIGLVACPMTYAGKEKMSVANRYSRRYITITE